MFARLTLLATLVATAPAHGQVVALDPAHGPPADQNEAMGREGRFARVLAARIADSLAARGIRSVVTTTDSSDPETPARVQRAKDAHATLLIGLHSEAPGLLKEGARGTIIGDTTDAAIQHLVVRLRARLELLLGGPLQVLFTRKFAAIDRFGLPGLIVKLGNNDDAADIGHLSSDPTLGELAGAIAGAIR